MHIMKMRVAERTIVGTVALMLQERQELLEASAQNAEASWSNAMLRTLHCLVE